MSTNVWFPYIHTYATTEPKCYGRGELDSPRFLASKPLSSICPTPPHLLPHPTSRDLADPVKLCLALHGYPLQGGQVQHCTASDIIVIMSAPGKIVVGKLERGMCEQVTEKPRLS